MPATYVVTGANRGIGLELARQLKERGEEVVATARRPGEAAELGSLGVRVEPLDVADGESAGAFAAALEGTPVDVLINNSGYAGDRRPLEELDLESMRACFEVNCVGALRLVRLLSLIHI